MERERNKGEREGRDKDKGEEGTGRRAERRGRRELER